MVSFSKFLDLFGAQQYIVEEVRRNESRAVARPQLGQRYRAVRERGYQAEQAVLQWARSRYGASEIDHQKRGFPDILLVDSDGEKVGIEVLLVPQARFGMWYGRLKDTAYRGYYKSHQEILVIFAIALVADSETEALELHSWLESRSSLDLPPTHFHIGYVSDDGRFEEVAEMRL